MTDNAEWFTLIAAAVPVALYTADADARLAGPRIVSEALAHSLGYQPADFVSNPGLWMSRVHPADLPGLIARAEQIAITGSFAVDYRWRAADDSERIFAEHAVVIGDQRGRPSRVQGIALDITERASMQRQLSQAQRMAAVGRITSTVAHELNNLLTVIMWNLDLMTRSLDGTSKDFDRAHIALSAALNGTSLLTQLTGFARPDRVAADAIDVGGMLTRVTQVLRFVLGADIAVETNVVSELWPIEASPDQLELALVNLAIHARQAMPEGGRLVIEASNLPARDPRNGNSFGRDAVVISVSGAASGPVSPPPEGRGNEMLAMVRSVVEASGGRLALDGPDGTMQTRLLLPRAAAAGSKTAAPVDRRDESKARAARTVLVVEDDPDVRNITVARLGEFGHHVLEADNAKAALDILGRDDAIDLLFTDIAMPGGMNGLELARRALQLRPDIRVLFVSGYTSSAHTEGSTPGEFLQKPYRQDDLGRALHRALHRGTTAAA
ncbi:MAG TPA: response regulator [Stellaceae bacterium]|nr:response regulator [Stellaceae bacterium]